MVATIPIRVLIVAEVEEARLPKSYDPQRGKTKRAPGPFDSVRATVIIDCVNKRTWKNGLSGFGGKVRARPPHVLPKLT